MNDWLQVPGVAALLSPLGKPLAHSAEWPTRMPEQAGPNGWRDSLEPDSLVKLLDALSRPQDFDIVIETGHGPGASGSTHWQCAGNWDARWGAHGCIFVDITQQEQARLDAVAVSTRIHLLFDQLPLEVAYFGPPADPVCLFANDRYARTMGFERHDIVGRLPHEIMTDDDRRGLHTALPAYVATGHTVTCEYRRQHGVTGQPVDLEVSFTAHRAANGAVIGTFVVMSDITERRRFEQSLLASQERLSRFMEASAEGVFFHRDGLIVDANPAACRLVGLSHAALIGRPMLSLSPAEQHTVSSVSIGSGADAFFETEVRHADDSLIPVEIIGRTMERKGDRLRMTVMRDIRDRRQAQARIHALIEDLRSQKDRAESADRAKSVFLAAASHDLRQPIHALGLFLTSLHAMAQAPSVSQASLAEICRRMQSSLDGLGQLLNMLLDVSRLDANAVQVDIAPASLPHLFAELEQEFADLAQEKGLHLQVVPTSAWVSTDATVLRRILTNLMANAIRYTPRGRVLLGARRRATHIEIQVWDSGVGIPPEQLDAIFEEFYQIGQTRAQRDESHGLGLGLSIVKRSARLIGAELRLRSTPGRGSMFSISVPSCTPPARQSLPEPVAPPVHAPAAPGQRHVLVIDDDEQVLMAMQQLLQVWGHRVWCAATADEAVVLAIEHTTEIDLLLTDYRLGGNVTAVQAIAAVHACLSRSVPTFILTGDTSPQRILEASDLGFPILHKPVDSHALLKVLER